MYIDKPPLDELIHYGMPRRSGRYPWGSGEDPYQHSGDFLSRIDELTKNGINTKNQKEKIHISIGLVDNLCHEVVYHKHSELDFLSMKEIVVETILSLLS